MSRAFKDGMRDDADALSTGAFSATGTEKLSGADLEQLRLSAANGGNPAVSSAGVKQPATGGTNAAHGGKNVTQLSGADQERFKGTQ